MKYRIIFLSALDIWSMQEGVGAPSFFNTLQLYAQQGHEVFLIKPTGKYHREYSIDGVEIQTFNQDFFDRFIRIRYISFFARIGQALYQKIKFQSIGSKLIKNANQKCIVYAYEVGGVSAARALHKKYKVPFITRFQGTVLCNVKNTFGNRLRRYPHFQALAQSSNMVIMTDDGTLGNIVLRNLGNTTDRTFFWRNGVEALTNKSRYSEAELAALRSDCRSRYDISEDEIVLMTLCRLTNWKRIDRAITALEETVRKHNHVKLVIVGEGEEKSKLIRMVKEKKLEPYVIFAGGIKQEETPKYYAMCDIFLSLYDLSNVGNPLLEALVYEKPIITLDNGGTSSVIQNGYNGILIPLHEEKNIGNALIEVIGNAELRARLAKGAKKFAATELWTWQERMQTEYKEAMKMADAYYETH